MKCSHVPHAITFYSCITSTCWISFDAIPNNLQFKKFFLRHLIHSQRVQVYREQMDVIIQGHLSASSELLVSGFNCFDWCLRWKHLVLAVTAWSDFFRLLQTPYSACCLRHTAGYHYNFFCRIFFFLINTIILFFTLPPKTKALHRNTCGDIQIVWAPMQLMISWIYASKDMNV